MIICHLVRRIVCILVASVLLLSVAAVFIAPTVNLQPTAMRAARAATMVLAALAILVALAVPRLGRESVVPAWIPAGAKPNFPSLIDLICARLR